MSQINLDTSNFPIEKILNIDANSLFEANYLLAHQTKKDIHQILGHCRSDLDYAALHAQAQKFFQKLLELRQSHPAAFTTADGTNHLENYLECFCGYCQGAGIDLEDGALLQLELYGGCQSLTVQSNSSHSIAGFHTEEDSTAYDHFDDSEFGKYFVTLNINDKTVRFLHYAGLCGWGSTYSLISTPTQVMFNTCDVLGPTVEGVVWSNAVNFMLLNCNSLAQVQELIISLMTLPNPKFIGGYTNTIVECCSPPRMLQVEFGGNKITTILPKNSETMSVHSGINFPHDPEIITIDVASEVEEPDKYDLHGLRQIYQDRFARLAQVATIVAPDIEHPFETIAQALKNPEGVWRSEWFTGFANCYVANHILFAINSGGDVELKLINGNP